MGDVSSTDLAFPTDATMDSQSTATSPKPPLAFFNPDPFARLAV